MTRKKPARRPPRAKPEPPGPLTAQTRIEEIEDTAAAAELYRAIRRAQEITKKERRDDAA